MSSSYSGAWCDGTLVHLDDLVDTYHTLSILWSPYKTLFIYNATFISPSEKTTTAAGPTRSAPSAPASSTLPTPRGNGTSNSIGTVSSGMPVAGYSRTQLPPTYSYTPLPTKGASSLAPRAASYQLGIILAMTVVAVFILLALCFHVLRRRRRRLRPYTLRAGDVENTASSTSADAKAQFKLHADSESDAATKGTLLSTEESSINTGGTTANGTSPDDARVAADVRRAAEKAGLSVMNVLALLRHLPTSRTETPMDGASETPPPTYRDSVITTTRSLICWFRQSQALVTAQASGAA
ncbi:hypothetical protein EXIGLDRAFT_725104 [Exidia glandulosa HHB12029]|uniref:Uncharacterized protein n=1 Tax=Exidia glandulosa HHB12029 TaxID=1314781 RepID=A0A165E6G5_EXIGL|nr:hypothetical protein EXIGLDRAFT_725104 [Exidia glandulosa HHB12029]